MDISFGKFVNYLVLLLHSNGINLLLHKQEAWHQLFYRLKRQQESVGKPIFLEELWFDWDKQYPTSPELSEYLNAMCVLGVVETNSPTFDRYWLSKDMEKLWQKQFDELNEEIKQYLRFTAQIAIEEFAKVVIQA